MAYNPDNVDDLKEKNDSDDISIEQKICDAICDDAMDELQMLLLEETDLNKLGTYSKKGKEKITPLHVACNTKNLKACKILLKSKLAKADVKSFPKGNTPLHIAAMWAQHKIVAFLLKNGANPVANNNKQKNPLQMIGSKYKGKQLKDIKVIEGKMETQILLLQAGGKKAIDFQDEIDQDVMDAKDGFNILKSESNARLIKLQKSGKVFAATHPYLYVKTNRMKAWKQKNKCSVQEYLNKKHIKVKVPQWEDKDNEITHIDLSKVALLQLASAKELLSSSGLTLMPEPQQVLPKRAKFKKEKANKKSKK